MSASPFRPDYSTWEKTVGGQDVLRRLRTVVFLAHPALLASLALLAFSDAMTL